MAGRPSKLTPELQKTITEAIVIGATYQAAAEYAGISYDAFNEWMKRTGKQYVEFRQSVMKANAQARVNLVAKIQMSAKKGDWRAAAWILERRFRDEYGAQLNVKAEIEHSWRDEAKQYGLNPDAMVENLFAKVQLHDPSLNSDTQPQ
jgi:transposase